MFPIDYQLKNRVSDLEHQVRSLKDRLAESKSDTRMNELERQNSLLQSKLRELESRLNQVQYYGDKR